MKTMVFTLCLLFVCILGLAQNQSSLQQVRTGVIYVYVSPDQQWAGDGFPPKIDPHAISQINPSFINPIDGSGPIGLDPTIGAEINPYLVFVVDGIDPGPGPYKRKVINPSFINPIEGGALIVSDPHKKKQINPSFLIVQD
jgi:hypothetical protein